MVDKKEINISENNYGTVIIGDNNTVNKLPSHKVPKIMTPNVGLYNEVNFVGRIDDLEAVERILNKNNIVLVNGIGGIGKSTFVSYYFNIKKNEFDNNGFIQVGGNIKTALVSALKTSLNLKSIEEIDIAFNEAIVKLRNLKGEKLLILDDIKNINNQKKELDNILTLENYGFKLIFTSRENLEKLPKYTLHRMNITDARNLFFKYYPTTETDKVDSVLKSLDRHTLFIELTAKTLREKEKTLNLDILIKKFENGEFPIIKRNRKETFNTYLGKLFADDKILLDNEILLYLKKLSVLPSIEISFEDLCNYFKCNKEDFEEILIELLNNGWIIKTQNNYKFHQVLKEYIIENKTPTFEEIDVVFTYFYNLIENSADLSIAISNKMNLIFFDAVCNAIKKYINFRIAYFYMGLGNIYRSLSEYKKALFYGKLSFHMIDRIEADIDNVDKIEIAKSSIYNNLSQIYYLLGQYKRTLILDKKALELRKKYLGEKNILTIQSYASLAQLYFSCGNNNENAKKMFKKSISNIKEIKADDKNNLITILHEKSTLYSNYASYLINNGGDENEILYYAKESVNLFIESGNESNPALLTYKFNLAQAYMHIQKYNNEAENLYLDVLNSNINYYGEFHNNVANAYMGISLFYSKNKEKHALSVKNMKKALAIYKEIFSDEHPSTALAYDNMASIYSIIGEKKLANEYSLKALGLHEKLLGNSHPITIKNYHNVGLSYYSLNNIEKSKHYLLKATQLDKSLLDDCTVNTIIKMI